MVLCKTVMHKSHNMRIFKAKILKLMGFIFGLFIVCVGGGWLVGKILGSLFTGTSKERETYIDKSVHHHHHYHKHTHQNLTIIDEETHKKGLGYFSDNKESR